MSGKELGWLRPTNADWSVMFEFDDRGYVKDDDKDKLDAANCSSTSRPGSCGQRGAVSHGQSNH